MLLCLRYITFQNGLPIIYETFSDSLHINGRPTAQTVGENILSLLQKNEIDIEKCRVYDGASATCGNSSGAASVIKKQQLFAKYIHCRDHILNLPFSFAYKNQSVKRFMDDLTSVCFSFDNLQSDKSFLNILLNITKMS